MAGNFLTHVEVLFTAIDDLQAQYRDIEDAGMYATQRYQINSFFLNTHIMG